MSKPSGQKSTNKSSDVAKPQGPSNSKLTGGNSVPGPGSK